MTETTEPRGRYVFGIDPGSSGGIAILNPFGDLVWWHKLTTKGTSPKFNPDDVDVVGAMQGLLAIQVTGGVQPFLPTFNKPLFALEKVNGIKHQSAGASFSFGRNTGIIIGAILAAFPVDHIETFEVHKLRWGPIAGIPIGSDKKASVNRALELWPNAAELGHGKFTDGPAEAALIAYSSGKINGGYL